MDEPLAALSIRQPWIDMIVRGAKTIEVRDREIQRRGPIALHAPWSIDFAAAYFYGYREPWDLPRGRILAVAEIVEVVALDADSWRRLLRRHRQVLPRRRGSLGVRLERVRALERAVRCRGRPGVFGLGSRVERTVRRLAGLEQRP